MRRAAAGMCLLCVPFFRSAGQTDEELGAGRNKRQTHTDRLRSGFLFSDASSSVPEL